MGTTLLENDSVVEALWRSIHDGECGLSQVPLLVKRTIRDACWQKRIIHPTGQVQEFARFEDFVTTPPIEGLGGTIGLLKRMCASDREALDLLDQVTTGEHGGDRKSEEAMTIKRDNVTLDNADRGNSPSYALRRLRKNRPDLHARVLANELSPNGAMVEAGFRERTVQIPLDVTRAAMALRRHFTGDALTQLRNALGEDVKDLA